MNGNFVWRDAGRVVVFRHEGVGQAAQLLHEHGFAEFELLTTPRALLAAPELEAAAKAVHAIPAGQVPDAAAALLDRVEAPQLVALGGGRTIDTVKAVAAVSGARVAAVLTSQPEGALRASAMNSLDHGADSLYTPFANPVSQMTALRGAELIAASLDEAPTERNRAALAQGSLLSAYAIDSAMFGMHHVICQTLVRICGSPHAETNATILPRAMAFIAPRATDDLTSLADAIGTTPDQIEPRILQLGGNPPGLGQLGADRTKLNQALDSMLMRPELAFTPEPPTRGDLERLIESAW